MKNLLCIAIAIFTVYGARTNGGRGFNIHAIVSTYAFSDKAPLLGLNYYRLKAVDLDGSYEYFTVRAVSIQGKKSLVVYPNPSNGQLISFRTNF